MNFYLGGREFLLIMIYCFSYFQRQLCHYPGVLGCQSHWELLKGLPASTMLKGLSSTEILRPQIFCWTLLSVNQLILSSSFSVLCILSTGNTFVDIMIFFMLPQDYTAKLSDFGLAKAGPEGDETHVSTRVMGTYGYAAPEYVMTGTFLLVYLRLVIAFLTKYNVTVRI